MDSMRNEIPESLGGYKLVTFGDYKAEEFTDVATGVKSPTGLPKSNVLYFKLENNDVIIVRPSGTEPKIKFYFLASGSDKAEIEAKIAGYKASLGV